MACGLDVYDRAVVGVACDEVSEWIRALVVTPKSLHIVIVQIVHCVLGRESCDFVAYSAAYFLKQVVSVGFVAKDLEKRHRVGSIAEKSALVDIEAYADDGVHDVAAHDGVFDENAGEFAIVVVDVVGPFDFGLYSEFFVDDIDDGHSCRFAERKLANGSEIGGTHKDSEGEILARLSFPRVAALSASGSLIVGDNDRVGQQLRVMLGDIRVGRPYLIEANNLHLVEFNGA